MQASNPRTTGRSLPRRRNERFAERGRKGGGFELLRGGYAKCIVMVSRERPQKGTLLAFTRMPTMRPCVIIGIGSDVRIWYVSFARCDFWWAEGEDLSRVSLATLQKLSGFWRRGADARFRKSARSELWLVASGAALSGGNRDKTVES